MLKTKEEIQKEIKAMKNVRPKVVPFSIFGDDNLAQFDAQLNVLENCMDKDDIYEEYDHSGIAEEILSAALSAREWLDGDGECESLAEDYPLKKDGD